MTLNATKVYLKKVSSILDKTYPHAKCSLDYKNPLQLLIATILSAQCTDQRVNIVTKDLFKTYKTANDFAIAPISELESAIKSTGFYRNKAKSIKGACTILQEKHGGIVPKTMPELLEFPGVARKTANVVLGNAFNIQEGIPVDTHVTRVTFRLGLTKNTNPVKIEQDLMKIVPKEHWTDFSHKIILHGRTTCKAITPSCSTCPLNKICPRKGVTKAV